MHDHQHTHDPDVEALWEAVREHEGAERARALCLVGEHLFENGDLDTALAAADAAKELFLAEDEVAEAAMCDHNAAVSLRSLGRLREAI